MNTGQTMLTIFAFALFMTLIANFYNTMALTGDSIVDGQNGILLTTISESYSQTANGLAFDANTDTTHISPSEIGFLTDPSLLGVESGETNDPKTFNDFDDFNGKTLDKSLNDKVFSTRFNVYYVQDDMKTYSSARTFFKRIDMVVYQSYPMVTNPQPYDTLKTFYIKGYFHFN